MVPPWYRGTPGIIVLLRGDIPPLYPLGTPMVPPGTPGDPQVPQVHRGKPGYPRFIPGVAPGALRGPPGTSKVPLGYPLGTSGYLCGTMGGGGAEK